MHHIHSSCLLKVALWVDAIMSGASGVLQLAAPDRLSALLQLPRPLLAGTGEFYLAYAATLLVLATRKRLWRPLVLLIVFGNLAWGLAGVAALLVGAIGPSWLGTAYVLMQVVAVTAFAAAQWLGLRRSGTERALSGPGHVAGGRV